MSADLYEKRITEGLKQLAGTYGPDAIIPVNVKSVDTDLFEFDCVTDDDIEMPGVLYKATQGGTPDVIFQPAVNSRVWIGRVADSDEWMMIKCGQVDKVFINANVEVVFNNGSNGGMVLRDGAKAQLNKIETDITNLKQLFTAWIPVADDGGAALKTAAASWAGTPLQQTVNADIENQQIKQ